MPPVVGSAFKSGGRDFIPQYDISEEGLEEAEILIATLISELDDPIVPLTAARRVAMEDMKDHFDTETDPNGNHWWPLTEEYERDKEAAGFPTPEILKRTHALMDAATSEEAWLITDDTIMFDSGVLPDYGYIHQVGTATADIHALNRDTKARHAFRVANEEGYSKETGGLKGNLGIGVGTNTPARPFIGMSEQAEGKVLAIFDAWFMSLGENIEGEAASSSAFIHPRTGVAQVRGAGGRFGKKIA